MTVQSIAEALWSYEVARAPYLQLRSGVPVEGLPVGSLDEADEDAAFARGQIEALRQIDKTSLPIDDWLTAEFLDVVLTEMTSAAEAWWWSFAVTPYGTYGLNASTMQVVASFDLDEPADAKRYRAVAADYAAAVSAAHDKLVRQTERGWPLPRAALPGALNTIRGVRATAERLFAEAETILAKEILPAVDSLLEYLDEYEPLAADGVGLGQYPGGAAAYEHLVRQHATYDIGVDAIHALGLSQVEGLTEELRLVREAVGFGGSEDEFRRQLEADRRMYATSAADVEARYRTAIARIEPVMHEAFSVLPEAPYDVARLDPSMEAGLTYGFYEPPTPAMPVGRYRYNGSGLETRSQLNAAAIIYHELIPGHHFHLARQAENSALPQARQNSLSFGAFNEGWAEYAAGVANELGMYEDPYDKYGWLIHQRFVAQRLVVDTGLNALGWSLQRARSYMSAMTFEAPEQVATETLRYATDLPGQAVGYRLGYLKLGELRQRLGRPAKEFHEVVLGPGALPLSVVAQHVDRLRAQTVR